MGDDAGELVDNPGLTKSSVWNFFGFWKVRGPDGRPVVNKEKAVCKICKYESKYHTNTTNLASHLRNKHPDDDTKVTLLTPSAPSIFQP